MVHGIGVDIVKFERIEAVYRRFGDRFARKVLSAEELSAGPITSSLIAKRFAAKEAIAKALGTGIGRGFGFHDITVSHDDLGKPLVILNSKNMTLRNVCGSRIHLSISDERTQAIAFCTIED